MALSKVKQIASSHPVVVFSKPYCGFCRQGSSCLTSSVHTTKQLSGTLKMMDQKCKPRCWNGLGPNVFFSGRRVGGCDGILRMHWAGSLEKMLAKPGAFGHAVAKQTMI